MTEIYRKSIPDRFHEEAGDISFKVEEDFFGAVCGCLLEEEDIVKVNLFMFHKILQACLSSKKCPSCEKQFYLEIYLLCLKYWKNILLSWDIEMYYSTWKTTKMSAVRHSVIDELLPNSSSALIAIRKYPSMQSIWICTVFLMFVDNVLSPFGKAVMPEENLGRNDTQCIKLIQEYP